MVLGVLIILTLWDAISDIIQSGNVSAIDIGIIVYSLLFFLSKNINLYLVIIPTILALIVGIVTGTYGYLWGTLIGIFISSTIVISTNRYDMGMKANHESR